jgi:hypothetical protein
VRVILPSGQLARVDEARTMLMPQGLALSERFRAETKSQFY